MWITRRQMDKAQKNSNYRLVHNVDKKERINNDIILLRGTCGYGVR